MVECHEEGLVSGALLSKSHQEATLTNSSLRLHQAMLMLQPDREDHLKEVDANRFEDNEVETTEEQETHCCITYLYF